MIARSGCGKRRYHCHSESFISSAGPAEGRVLSTNSPDVLAPAAQVAALRLGARSSPLISLFLQTVSSEVEEGWRRPGAPRRAEPHGRNAAKQSRTGIFTIRQK